VPLISNLIFLILVLLLAGVVQTPHDPPSGAIPEALLVYGLVLLLILCQNILGRRLFASRQRLLLLANVELVGVLAFFQFSLQLGASLPLTLKAIFFLVLYFAGLIVFYLTAHSRSTADQQIRLLIPFTLPFLLFCLVADLTTSINGQWLSLTIVSATLIAFLLFLMPPLIIRLWHCQPIPNQDLRARLLALCARASFRHGGIFVWSAMRSHFTAAIVGMIPRFRYILFTQGVLDKLSADEVEAILAHEIGHSYHRHLLLYPFIIFGVLPILMLFERLVPGLSAFVLFVLEALILLVYLRLVFGYFSRLFERQADLYGFRLNLDPRHMIQALDHLAILSGHIHQEPSWHHYSIDQRIQFLTAAMQNPALIQRHHRLVRGSLFLYLIAVAMTALLSLLLL
jgi:Zn-dependent protease with chaperone function